MYILKYNFIYCHHDNPGLHIRNRYVNNTNRTEVAKMSIHSPSSQISLSLLLDQITDKDLVEAVEKMERDIMYMELENEVFENFLKQTDPQLIAGNDAN